MQPSNKLGIFFGVTLLVFVAVVAVLHYDPQLGKDQNSYSDSPYQAYPQNQFVTQAYVPPAPAYSNYYADNINTVASSTPIVYHNVKVAPGIIGNAAIFTEGSSRTIPSYIELPKNSSINDADQWSFSFWVYFNDNSDATIFSKQEDGVDSESVISVGYYVSQDGGAMEGEPGVLYFHPSNPGANASSASPLQSGKWNYVVITNDQANIDVYINGVRDSSQPAFDNAAIVNNLNETSVSLGAWLDSNGNDLGLGPELNGKIDQFAFFDNVLTPGQISAYYNSGKGIAIPSNAHGLVTMYDFSSTTSGSN